MNLFQELKEKKILDKDGKVDALGPYGRQKLTGREISTYFRKNKVNGDDLRKAVGVALDLGGAMDIARQEIKKFYGDKILKSKEVQHALRYANESVEMNENYRVLAQKGMGTESEKEARVGLEMDFYDSKGNKQFGKIVKKDRKGYTVKDDKGKMHTFVFLDRQKAKKLLKQGDNLEEKVEYAEYKFRNKGDAQKALDYFKKQNLIKLDINDDNLNGGELAVDAGKKDMSKYHKEVLRKFKPKVQVQEKADKNDKLVDLFNKLMDVKHGSSQFKKIKAEIDKLQREAVSPAQQAAIAIAKKEKEKKENMESLYREMFEQELNEEVANITVDPRNKISKSADQNKHSLEIVKQARRFGLKASQMGKHVRIKGAKKAVNDFLRIIIGKSSYGDPTEKDMSTPQIDKMLTKDLK